MFRLTQSVRLRSSREQQLRAGILAIQVGDLGPVVELVIVWNHVGLAVMVTPSYMVLSVVLQLVPASAVYRVRIDFILTQMMCSVL